MILKGKKNLLGNPVDNFLISMDLDMPMEIHILNAMSDSKSYQWNKSITDKIIKGIKKAYKERKGV